MAMGLKYYPPSVKGAPRSLTAPRPLYLFFALVVLVSLFAYLALYLAMIAGVAWLTYFLATDPDVFPLNRYGVILRLGLTAISGMLWLFLLKGLFKRHETDLEHYTEIMEAGQPELFAFIRRLCREVGAPFPHRIFFSPDVNAGVFYDSSLLNLVLPVRKNLIIGLGLVQCLTINEFKAVLAHEFGHFAQSTTLLGQYVNVANRVIAGMIFEEDAWDEWLENWKEVEDFRISIWAWLLAGIIWVFRLVLILLFHLINLFHFALARQMEFQADRVAVSITGSDAIVNALIRLRAAAAAYQQTLQDLHPLALRGVFTNDVYYHQERAESYLRRLKGDPEWGKRPTIPEGESGPTYFCSLAGERPSLFSSHPSLYEREQNAKRRYLPGEESGEPAWVLFRDVESTRAAASFEAYEELGLTVEEARVKSAAEVQREIRAEESEGVGDERYGGLYDQRLLRLTPATLEKAVAEIGERPWLASRIQLFCGRLYRGEVRERMQAHVQRRRELQELRAIGSGQQAAKVKSFRFRGQQRPVGQAKDLARAVEHELTEDGKWLEDLDRQVLQAHLQMGESLRAGLGAVLLARYRFHVAAQEALRSFNEAQPGLQMVDLADRLPGGSAPEAHAALLQAWSQVLEAAAAIHQQSRQTCIPDFPEITSATGRPAGATLAEWLALGPPSPPCAPGTLPDSWTRNRCRQELRQVGENLPRLLAESLRAIVRDQEQIAGAWLARYKPPSQG